MGRDRQGVWDRTGGVCGMGWVGHVGWNERGMWDGMAGHVGHEPRDGRAIWGALALVFGM